MRRATVMVPLASLSVAAATTGHPPGALLTLPWQVNSYSTLVIRMRTLHIVTMGVVFALWVNNITSTIHLLTVKFVLGLQEKFHKT